VGVAPINSALCNTFHQYVVSQSQKIGACVESSNPGIDKELCQSQTDDIILSDTPPVPQPFSELITPPGVFIL
jgi:hypothetical protein